MNRDSWWALKLLRNTKTPLPSSWAKSIWRNFENYPLIYTKCGEQMRIIAINTDNREIAKIIEHISEQI